MIESPRPRVYAWVGQSGTDLIDLSPDVVHLTWQRDISAPCAQWSMVLAPRQLDGSGIADVRRAAALYKLLRQNTPVSLGVDEAGGLGLGLVSDVRRQVTTRGPAASYTLEVSGLCVGKALVNDQVVLPVLGGPGFERWRSAVEEVLGPDHPLVQLLILGPKQTLDAREGPIRTFTGATVRDVVEFILGETASMKIPLLAKLVGGDGRLSGYLDLTYVDSFHDGRIWSEGLQQYHGSLWGFIRELLDEDFYECRVDYRPTGVASAPAPHAHLIIRPRPFDEQTLEHAPVSEEAPGLGWDDIRNLVDGAPWHEVLQEEVYAQQLGTSDKDAYSYYNVSSGFTLLGNSEALNLGLGYPLLDLWAVQKVGLRKYDTRIKLVGGDLQALDEDDVDYNRLLLSEVEQARNRLFNWYRLNAEFEAGTIVVRGRDRYRCGDRVRLPWQEAPRGGELGMDYYLVATAHTWALGQPYTCTLGLSRGHNAAMVRDVVDEIRSTAGGKFPGAYVDISSSATSTPQDPELKG